MKHIKTIILCTVITLLLTFGASATDENNEVESMLEESFFSSSLDGVLSSTLEDFGIDSLNGEDIFSKGTENIKRFFSETLKEKVTGAAGWFFIQLSLIMILSVFSGAFDLSGSDDMLSLLCAVIFTVSTVERLNVFINCTVSAMELNGRFMLSFIPVFTVLISLSGNPASALTYNSFVLLFCELMSFAIDKVLVFFIGAYFALSISFSFNGSFNLGRFVNAVNRGVNFILGLTASMFTGFLSLKNVLSYATDSLSVKGIRFMLSSLVPVIGPSLSEAYSSVLGSINLMKSSLAVVGILALVIINIPALTEGLIYFFLISVLSGVCEMFSLNRASEFLRSFSGCIKILLLFCLFQLFILVISMGIMLSLRGSVNG